MKNFETPSLPCSNTSPSSILPLMRTLIFAFLGFVLLGSTACNPKPAAPVSPYATAIDSSRTWVQDLVASKNFPGAGVAVSVGRELIWSEGFGYADIASGKTIDPAKTLFRVGSISKPYTAAGLARLYEDGRIDLDTSVYVYVPDFPKKPFDFNLRQLGGHLAGIRHYKGDEFSMNQYFATVTEGLDIFKNDTLLFEPGTQYTYSSYGWNLISAAMEAVTDEPFLDYIQTAVFDPLDMKQTFPEYSSNTYPERVSFYMQSADGQNEIAPTVDNSYKWAGGGFISTPEDVVRFGEGHLSAGYLQEATLSMFTTSQRTADGVPTNYGIGWRSGTDDKGRYWYGHSGGSVGGTSWMVVYPEEEVVVVVLVNLSGADFDDIQLKIADAFIK
jgi:serine beta-lactamase-like protein LACTB, mitochondrial